MITYTIQVPFNEQKLKKFAAHLNKIGIEFDVLANMQYIDFADAEPDLPVRTGDDIPMLINEINNYLKQENINSHIPTNYQHWSLTKCYNFLRLAVSEFEWEQDKVLHSFRKLSYSSWPHIADEYSVDLVYS